MNRSILVILLLAVAIAALALVSFSLPTDLSEKIQSCPSGGNCSGNCSHSGGEAGVCSSRSACQENNSEENCSAAGSCPLKQKVKEGGCRARCAA